MEDGKSNLSLALSSYTCKTTIYVAFRRGFPPLNPSPSANETRSPFIELYSNHSPLKCY
jgi:hypothetical protein